MSVSNPQSINTPPPNRQSLYLPTLQRLLAIRSTEIKASLTQASDIVTDLFQADKVDTFLYDQHGGILVAVGTSTTPLSDRQKMLGLDKLSLENGSWEGRVFQNGDSLLTGHADQEPDILPGIKYELGIRSQLVVPLSVHEARRGVLSASSIREELYTPTDLSVLETVAHWVGIILHRAELMAQISAPSPIGQISDATTTLEHLTKECTRLQGEVAYWRATADELLLELQRWQIQAQASSR